MPYIQISLSKKLTDEEKRTLAAGVAALVPMLPGKPGDRAIVQIDDGRSLYRGGEPAACAFMETRLYGKTPEPYLRAYTEKLLSSLRNSWVMPETRSISIFWSWTTGAQRGACGECALKKNCPERAVLFLFTARPPALPGQ